MPRLEPSPGAIGPRLEPPSLIILSTSPPAGGPPPPRGGELPPPIPMRDWIPTFFRYVGGLAQSFINQFIVNTRAHAISWIRYGDAWEQWSRDTVDWWLGWAPWPINIVTDWFGNWIKDSVIYPLFYGVRWPFVYIRDYIDHLWDDDGRDYEPALATGWWFIRTGDGIQVVFDDLFFSLLSVAQTASDALADVAYQLWDSLNSLEDQLHSMQTDTIQALWDWVILVNGTLDVIRQDLDDARDELYDITQDPAGWVWLRIDPVLTEKVRLWLLDIW